jgi:hypothetical protein
MKISKNIEKWLKINEEEMKRKWPAARNDICRRNESGIINGEIMKMKEKRK